MAKFLKDNELNLELQYLLEKAQEEIVLISPYIKLHTRLIKTLRDKKENPDLRIYIVFGKNEDDPSKSLSKEDLDFFKEFPNIEIRYEKDLHAKYYANEKKAILTSMNLHSHSQDKNIEFGVLVETSIFGNLLDADAFDYFDKVINDAVLLYEKMPRFESKLLGLSSKYIDSEVVFDETDQFFTNRKTVSVSISKKGFCIRTGIEIPFNLEKPFGHSAYKAWAKYGDKDYAEKFCHFSGEPSEGKTSFSKPILAKNWKVAKDKYSFK